MTAPAEIGVDLADPELYASGDPDGVWEQLRSRQPVYRNPAGHGPPFWAITRHADALSVYRDQTSFGSEQGMVLGAGGGDRDPAAGRMLVVTDPPRHTELRRVMARAFTPRTLRGLALRVGTLVDQLVDRAAAGDGTCEFVDEVASRLPVAVICQLLGVPASDQDWMYHLTSSAFGGGDPAAAAAGAPGERAEAYADILLYYRDLAADRQRRPREDLVSVLVGADVGGAPLDVEDVLLNCTNLIIGGNETTRHAAAGGVLALAGRPAEWAHLRDAPGAVPVAVEEILRWTTPGMHVMRVARRDTRIADVDVGAGDRVVVWNAAANRDPEVFDHPQRFDVSREPNRHLAFGHGVHHCLGAALARIELCALFERLAQRVVDIELTGPVSRVNSCVLRGIKRLPVRLRAASPPTSKEWS